MNDSNLKNQQDEKARVKERIAPSLDLFIKLRQVANMQINAYGCDPSSLVLAYAYHDRHADSPVIPSAFASSSQGH